MKKKSQTPTVIKTTKETLHHEMFRAYDIRGIVDVDLTEEAVHDIGLALGSEAQSQNETLIVVGRDGRLSGPKLIQALKEGILATGCDVMDIGVVPTPVLYFAAQTLGTGSGVMLTGSHNPVNYNGLKMVIAGNTLSGDDIQSLKQRILKGNVESGVANEQNREPIPDYISCIVDDVIVAKPLKIVVDAGNGVAGEAAPLLFRELGCEVHELYCEIDGHFPNHHPDPSQPENLQELIKVVQEQGADIGLAFDGDGDRLGVVTPKGEIIYPDRQLMLYARELLKEMPSATIVFDVKCTKNLASYIEKFGGIPIMAKTGHALIKKKIKEVNAALAGEMSGHTFFNDRWFGFDDALYTGARLLEILTHTDLDADQLFDEIPQSINTPEINITVPESRKFEIVHELVTSAHNAFPNAEIIRIDGVRLEFEDGWGLVRASNTTPCLVMRFEADSDIALKRIQTQMAAWVDSFIL